MDSHQWQTHASEARLILKAKTEAGLFEKGLHAIYDSMDPKRGNAVAPIVNLDLKGQDMAHLLVEFLSSVITWSHAHKAHYHTMIIHQISHSHLIAVLEGHAAESFKHEFKSVTTQGAHIDNTEGWFHANISFKL
jgi:SHS2 domain-containing protein